MSHWSIRLFALVGIVACCIGQLHVVSAQRHWSVRYDGADTAVALEHSTLVTSSGGGLGLSHLLTAKTDVAIVLAAPSNFRERGVSYDGSEDLYLAWKAIQDAPAFVPRARVLLADVDMSIPASRRDFERFVGRKVGSVPRLFVLARRNMSALVGGKGDSEGLPPAWSFARRCRHDGWVELGLERGGDRTYSETKYLLEALYASSAVRQFCNEHELRDSIQMSTAANYATVAVWDYQDAELVQQTIVGLVDQVPRTDIVVTVLGSLDDCAAAPEAAADVPRAAHYLNRDREGREFLRQQYNPWGYAVTLHLIRPWLDPVTGFVTKGFTYRLPRGPLDTEGSESDLTPSERGLRLKKWIGMERRHTYPQLSGSVSMLAKRHHKVVIQPSGASCAMEDRPRIGDRVLLEGIVLTTSDLLEFSRWHQRNVTVGNVQDFEDLPAVAHAAMLDACVGVTVNVALAGTYHMFSLLQIDPRQASNSGGTVAKATASDHERQRKQLIQSAIDRDREERDMLRRVDALQNAHAMHALFPGGL